MLGLEKGHVVLCLHEKDWEDNAKATIQQLKKIFGLLAVDIQHIGSTSISNIIAKPIIDIIVGINDFDRLLKIVPYLESNGLVHRPNNDMPDYKMFVMGDMKKQIRTHHIHVVQYDGEEWRNQINFRDYLNANSEIAKEYERLKIKLCKEYPNNRATYTKSKDDYIHNVFLQAEQWVHENKSTMVKPTYCIYKA
jgi:GrpB-like predicted nucleotidyltransferase (UPF0157 family)